MRKVFLVTFILAIVAVLVGCGSTTSNHSTPKFSRPETITQACPPRNAFLGCSLKTHKLSLARGSAPSGPLFPDVSNYQGNVDWPAVKSWQQSHGWKPAAIFKIGEYSLDSKASRNASELSRLGFWSAGYWFVRPTGCSTETDQIISAGHNLHLKVIVLDAEVPQVPGYVGCLAPRIKAAGFVVVVYTAPGTWPGGSGFGVAPLWQATYGPRPSHWFWNPIVAWQFTDGQFFAPVSIPGIGRDDVNLDLGITRLGVSPPPDPYRLYPKTVFALAGHQHASEYNTVKTWDNRGCRNPVHRTVCVTSRAHLVLLRNRLDYVAHHPLVHGRPTWNQFNRGPRRAGINRRINQ